jgi:hypothetical protein
MVVCSPAPERRDHREKEGVAIMNGTKSKSQISLRGNNRGLRGVAKSPVKRARPEAVLPVRRDLT